MVRGRRVQFSNKRLCKYGTAQVEKNIQVDAGVIFIQLQTRAKYVTAIDLLNLFDVSFMVGGSP